MCSPIINVGKNEEIMKVIMSSSITCTKCIIINKSLIITHTSTHPLLYAVMKHQPTFTRNTSSQKPHKAKMGQW